MSSATAKNENIPDDESRSHTSLKFAKFTHTWTISDFSFLEHKVGHCLTSVTFPLSGDGQHNPTEWCLKLYPNGYAEGSKDFVSVFLCLLATKKHEVKARYKIGIVNATGAKCALESSTEIHKIEVNRFYGSQSFVKQNYLLNKANGLMQDDKLVLFCEVSVLEDISNTLEKVNNVQFTEPKDHLLANIGKLFETKKFSDVTFTACGKEFQAHKAILAAQSSVFSEMFEHAVEEKKLSCFDIIDMDDEALNEMLLFLYTGEVKNIQKNAVHLLAAADQYAIEKLKIMCEEALHASLTIENAADTLILADLYNADHLKPRVISFIRFYAADVMATEGFESMLLSHPSLITEAFQKGNSDEISKTDAAPSKLNASAKNIL